MTHSYRHGLNEKYTFENFIVGSGNELAYAACQAVAASPGKKYNPLYLYGGVGIGKTHLIQAVGNAITSKSPSAHVVYISTEQFVQEFLDAIRYKKNTDFAGYYRSADVLIVDDVQFIAGKEKTQEEFFHTFNELHEAKKQIVISSDKHPREISTLEERLRSRFEWGITADIQPPDYETKMAILNRRAELENLTIEPEVMQYIANNINSNIRELEGALNKICELILLEGRPIDLALAEEALKDMIETQKEITPQIIMELVAEHFKISVADILSKKKNKEIAIPRQICMYLSKTYTDYSFQAIGNIMGNRDHSTVLHGHNKINDIMNSSKDDGLKTTVDILVKKLNPPS